jgi:hypothetical protein
MMRTGTAVLMLALWLAPAALAQQGQLPIGAYRLTPGEFADWCQRNPTRSECSPAPTRPPATATQPAPSRATKSDAELWREFDSRDRTAPGRPLTREEQQDVDSALKSLRQLCAAQPQLAACH